MTKIFVSYRRDDSLSETDRICDYLRQFYGTRGVFRDLQSIEGGQSFKSILDQALATCHVCVVVIGEDWVGRRRGTLNRLQFKGDFVRYEIETALQRGLTIIPVLIRKAELPKAKEIPPEISNVLGHQALRVRHDPDFQTDVTRLRDAIDVALGIDRRRSRLLAQLAIGVGISLFASISGLVFLTAGSGSDANGESGTATKTIPVKTSTLEELPRPKGEVLLEKMLMEPSPPLDFPGDTPLSEVLEFISDYYNLQSESRFRITVDAKDPVIGIDSWYLENVNVRDVNIRGVELRSALALILAKVQEDDLTFRIENEVILISTREWAEKQQSANLKSSQ